jgi:hypothetical protein
MHDLSPRFSRRHLSRIPCFFPARNAKTVAPLGVSRRLRDILKNFPAFFPAAGNKSRFRPAFRIAADDRPVSQCQRTLAPGCAQPAAFWLEEHNKNM